MTFQRRTVLFVGVLGFSATLRQAQAESANWQAGVASTVITPEAPMWMSGYASRDHEAEGTLHDLWAKALVLEDPNGRRAVLVTLDLVGIDRPTSRDICDRLKEKYQLQRDQIALAISHTHSGPVVGANLRPTYSLDESQWQQVTAYTESLKDQVVDVVGEALQNLQAVTLRHGLGQASFAVNRRNNPEPDVPRLREAGRLRGPSDHDLPVLTVSDAGGQLVAVVFGYACHATTLDSYQWSGDWPGSAQLEIQKRHPGCTALFWAGCGADQNPIPRRAVELVAEYGRQIADGVDAVLAENMAEVEGPLVTEYREIDLAFAELPTEQQMQADTHSDNQYVARRAEMLLAQLREKGGLAATYPYPIQVWLLGDDVTFVILGGEVVVDYSIRLKHELDETNPWIAGYANDVMAYIPSRRVLKEGGYEGASAMVYYGLPSAWAPDIEEKIVAAVHEMLETPAAVARPVRESGDQPNDQ